MHSVTTDEKALLRKAEEDVAEQSRNAERAHETGFSEVSLSPCPRTARIWQRQAEHDLETARNDLDGSPRSYCWVCYKCHVVSSISYAVEHG